MESTLNTPVSLGMFLTFGVLALLALYIYLSSRREVELGILQQGVNELNELAKHHEARISLGEGLVTRLTALQETTDRRLLAIERRHENNDAEVRRKSL